MAATAEGALRDARPATLSSLAWAFGRVGGGVAEASPEAVPALAELHNAVAAEAAPRLGDFSPIDLHAMAIGLCRAPDGLPAPLAHAIVADVRRDNFGAAASPPSAPRSAASATAPSPPASTPARSAGARSAGI